MTTGDGRSPGPSWTALKESSRRTASHVDRSPSSQMQDELEESVPPPPRKRRPRRSGSGDEANGGKSKKRPKVYDGLQGTSSGQVRTKEPPFVNFGGSGEPAGSSSSAFPVVRKKKKRKILNEDELAELARQPAPSLSADLGPSSSRPVKTFTASQPVISRPLKVSAKRKARATDSSSDEAVVIPRKNSSSDVATRIVSATQPAGRTERRDSVNVREDEPTRGSVATSISKLVPPRLKPLPGEATKPCPSFKTPPATQPVTSRKDTSSSVLPQTQPTPLRSVQKPGHVSSSSARGRSMSPSRSSSPEFPESISAMVAADLARPKQVARKVPSSAFRHKRGSQKEKWQKGLEKGMNRLTAVKEAGPSRPTASAPPLGLNNTQHKIIELSDDGTPEKPAAKAAKPPKSARSAAKRPRKSEPFKSPDDIIVIDDSDEGPRQTRAPTRSQVILKFDADGAIVLSDDDEPVALQVTAPPPPQVTSALEHVSVQANDAHLSPALDNVNTRLDSPSDFDAELDGVAESAAPFLQDDTETQSNYRPDLDADLNGVAEGAAPPSLRDDTETQFNYIPDFDPEFSDPVEAPAPSPPQDSVETHFNHLPNFGVGDNDPVDVAVPVSPPQDDIEAHFDVPPDIGTESNGLVEVAEPLDASPTLRPEPEHPGLEERFESLDLGQSGENEVHVEQEDVLFEHEPTSESHSEPPTSHPPSTTPEDISGRPTAPDTEHVHEALNKRQHVESTNTISVDEVIVTAAEPAPAASPDEQITREDSPMFVDSVHPEQSPHAETTDAGSSGDKHRADHAEAGGSLSPPKTTENTAVHDSSLSQSTVSTSLASVHSVQPRHRPRPAHVRITSTLYGGANGFFGSVYKGRERALSSSQASPTRESSQMSSQGSRPSTATSTLAYTHGLSLPRPGISSNGNNAPSHPVSDMPPELNTRPLLVASNQETVPHDVRNSPSSPTRPGSGSLSPRSRPSRPIDALMRIPSLTQVINNAFHANARVEAARKAEPQTIDLTLDSSEPSSSARASPAPSSGNDSVQGDVIEPTEDISMADVEEAAVTSTMTVVEADQTTISSDALLLDVKQSTAVELRTKFTLEELRRQRALKKVQAPNPAIAAFTEVLQDPLALVDGADETRSVRELVRNVLDSVSTSSTKESTTVAPDVPTVHVEETHTSVFVAEETYKQQAEAISIPVEADRLGLAESRVHSSHDLGIPDGEMTGDQNTGIPSEDEESECFNLLMYPEDASAEGSQGEPSHFVTPAETVDFFDSTRTSVTSERPRRSSRLSSSRSSSSIEPFDLVEPVHMALQPRIAETDADIDEQHFRDMAFHHGFGVISWKTDRKQVVRKFREFAQTGKLAEDIPHELQDRINALPAAARRADRMQVKLFEAAIAENTADDEPNAPPIRVINEIDDELTPPYEFHYSNLLWHGPGVPLPDEKNLVGCDCIGPCDPLSKTCACVQRQQQECDFINGFLYDARGRLRVHEYPIFECNAMCGCSEDCINRVVQHGRKHAIIIQKTQKKGWGVFAGNKRIPAHTFVGIYAGEYITDEEGEKRGKQYNKFGRTYLFDVDFWYLKSHLDNPNEWDVKYLVDAYHVGNFTRYLNHSCDPNCFLNPCYINESNIDKPLLAIFTLRDVEPGEELCFSYYGLDDEDEGVDPKAQNKTFSKDDAVYVKCECGAKKCRGRMWRDATP